MIKINLNDTILVKLKPAGYEILAEKHNQIHPGKPKTAEDFKAKADKEGYSRFQLWNFIQIFGASVNVGFNAPFNINILVDADNTLGDEPR